MGLHVARCHPRFRFQISNPSGNLLTDLSFTEPFPSPIFDLFKMLTSRVMVKVTVMEIIVKLPQHLIFILVLGNNNKPRSLILNSKYVIARFKFA